MSSEKHSGSNVPLIVTIATAAVATIAVIILLIVMGQSSGHGGESSQPSESVFTATAEFANECGKEAAELVSANYEVIRLFVTEGLPKKKVYGKEPEPIDGAYVTESDKYTEYSQIEALVKSIYTEDVADEILKRTRVKSGEAVISVQPYSDHNVNGAVFLGMNTQFAVDESYDTDWSNCLIDTEPTSETECKVTVYVNGVTAETAGSHPESVLKVTMIKTADGWRFTKYLK